MVNTKIATLFFVFALIIMGQVSASDMSRKFTPSQNSNSFIDVKVNTEDDIRICFEDRLSVSIGIEIENLGSDSIGSLQLGWYLASDQFGSIGWSGNVLPNTSTKLPLTVLSFNQVGSYDIVLWAHHIGTDVNLLNDTTTITVIIDPPFVFSELKDTTVCPNTFLPLNLSSGVNSYQWNNGAVGENIVINGVGQYKVSVTNADGCLAVDSMALLEYLAPLDVVPNDTVICEGEVLVLGVSDELLGFIWNIGDTVSSIDIDTSGTYSFYVVDFYGCIYSDTINVFYESTTPPSMPSDIYFCEGDSTILTVASVYTTYQWSNGASGSSISTNVPGTYYVTVTGSSGCYGFDTVNVLMSPLPILEFPNSQMCNNEPFVLDIGWYSNIRWSNGDSVQSTLVSQPGLYTVTVSDVHGCSTVDSITVSNNNVSVSLGPDMIICDNTTTYIGLGVFDTYLWENGDVGNGHHFGEAGIYSVTVSNAGCFDSDEVEVIEVADPISDFEMDIDLVNRTVDFTNLSDHFSNVSWDFSDGASSTMIDPIHTFTNYGLFEVTLTIWNVCDTSSTIQDLGLFPLADKAQVEQERLTIFPTLAREKVNIKLGQVNGTQIEYFVYDASGKILIQKIIPNPQVDQIYQMDVSRFASGSYFVKVVSKDMVIGVQQFLKQ